MAYLLNNKKILGIVIGILLADCPYRHGGGSGGKTRQKKDPAGDTGHSAVEDPAEDLAEDPGETPAQQPESEAPDNTPVVFHNPDEMREYGWFPAPIF